jgi:hypothetical protein
MAVRKFTDVDFSACGRPLQLLESGLAVARGTAADVDYYIINGEHFEVSSQGANTEIIFKAGAAGLIPPVTAGDNIGIEMTQGLVGASLGNFKSQYTVGTDPAFYFSLKLKLATLADYDILAVGFRGKATTGPEDYVAVASLDTPAELLTAYDSIAAINHQTTVLHSVTRSAGATGTDTTSTTALVAATTATLTVKVSSAGAVTYFKDGVELAGMAAFSFAAGTIVAPFVNATRGQAGTVGTLQFLRWTSGLQ